jgi:c(7)-type cytochrome triheme protein
VACRYPPLMRAAEFPGWSAMPNVSDCRRFLLLIAPALFLQLQWNIYAANNDGGFVIYPAGPQSGPVVFNHRMHANAGYSCDKCHAARPEKISRITMGEIRQGKACGSCHDGLMKSKSGRQASSIEECGSCHMPAADIVFKLNRMDPVKFSHVKHLAVNPGKKISKQTGLSCADCHPSPFDRDSQSPIGMEVPHEDGGCTLCHNERIRDGKIIFAANTRCLTCHKSDSSQ